MSHCADPRHCIAQHVSRLLDNAQYVRASIEVQYTWNVMLFQRPLSGLKIVLRQISYSENASYTFSINCDTATAAEWGFFRNRN